MSTPQRRYEYHADRALDKDLAETIASACCEKCGRELVDGECAECKAKREEEL